MGPLLFVLYINDLSDNLRNKSDIYMYADDTKIYKRVKTESDVKKLQEDIEDMYEWSKKWLLKFHPKKCKYMRIGKTEVENGEYRMTEKMDKVNSEKDIGVVVDDQLEFSEHLAEKINKANRLVGLIRRTFVALDEEIFRSLYVTKLWKTCREELLNWCLH